MNDSREDHSEKTAPERPGLAALRLPLLSLILAALLGSLSKTAAWTRADLHLDELVHSVRTPWLSTVARGFDVAFAPISAIALTALLTTILITTGRLHAAATTVSMIAAGWGMSSLFKAVVARPRPPFDHQLITQYGHDSFPSGHVSITLVLVMALAVLARNTRRFRAVVIIGAVLVTAQAFARLYLGVHYPTDVIGSCLTAPAGALIALALWRRHDAGRPRPRTTVSS
ncbi:phosphatase PAP2 family protein [Streptosporangium sp. V21-05]|uniref:phosphatase PAP2 family protein n=1 Tax=Streptosporangium sp. V21-05 TaxID=3446115 RepID=UPI003F539A9B